MEFPIRFAVPLQEKYILYAICKSNSDKEWRGHGGDVFWVQLSNKGIKTDNLWYIGTVNEVSENTLIGEMSSENEIKTKFSNKYEDYTMAAINSSIPNG